MEEKNKDLDKNTEINYQEQILNLKEQLSQAREELTQSKTSLEALRKQFDEINTYNQELVKINHKLFISTPQEASKHQDTSLEDLIKEL